MKSQISDLSKVPLNKVDGTKAVVQTSFPRHHGKWDDATENCSNWLEQWRRLALGTRELYAVVASPTVQPDNRITRYFRESNTEENKTLVGLGCSFIAERTIELRQGLVFVAATTVSVEAQFELIKRFRTSRSSFFIIAESEQKSVEFLERYGALKQVYPTIGIDNKLLHEQLVGCGSILTRIWGAFDDSELVFEIYGDV